MFDGVTKGSALGWKYDFKNSQYSNEFYQFRDVSAPFVGVTSQKFHDIDILGTWFVKGLV